MAYQSSQAILRGIVRRFTRLFVACLMSWVAGSARADAISQVSILCVWEILVTISAIADACSLDRGTEIGQAIQESVGKLDHYILEHSELPDAQLLAGIEKKKQHIRAGYRNIEASACDPANEDAIVHTYLYFVEQNPPATLRRLVDDEIAAPRADPFAGFCI